MRSERIRFLVGVVPLLMPGTMALAAAPAPVAVARLEVDAPPDCATREELVARVASRSPRIRFERDAAAGPALRATIAPGPGGAIHGEVAVLRPDGRRSSRRLSAPSCTEAIDAIALVIVMTLDPELASDTPAPAHRSVRPPVGPPVPPDVPVAASAPHGSAGPPARPPARPLAGPPAPSDVPVAVSNSPSQPRWNGGHGWHARFGLDAAGQAIWGVAPRALPGIALFTSASFDGESVWSPALILGASHASTDNLVEPGGTAAFALDSISLDACPIRLRLRAIETRACGTGLAGRLSARGSNTYSPRSQARPFGALGVSALVTIPLGRILELSGRLGLGASLFRDAFEFTPGVFHRVSSATLVLCLGLGVRFP